jgi:preprotein translocase subunit SecY
MALSALNLLSKGGGLAELKSRLLIVLMGILIYRIGAHIPVPGIDPVQLAHFFSQQQGTLFGVFNMFSGGALQRFTVFAIGIMPYISASIIIQMFSMVSPSLAQLRKEGEQGQRKLNQYTRYLTLLIACVQGFGLSKWLVSFGIAYQANVVFYFTATITLVTGTLFLVWLGEQMTERGVGNGISLIIFSGIVARLPSDLGQLLEQVKQGQMQGLSFVTIVTLVILVIAIVVFIERGQRRILVNHAQRTRGRKVYAAQSTHLPLKINMAGVIPPIFAMSLLALPSSIAQWFSAAKQIDWLGELATYVSPGHPIYMILFSALILFFAFFYTALVFNPKETADNLKKSGAYVPGIRPGEQTAKYIDGVMTRLTLAGAVYLLFVCLVPDFMVATWHVQLTFGGTSLLIVVVVLMDFVAQVQSHLMSSQYDSLMKKANFKGKLS